MRLAQKPAFLDLEAFDPVAPMASLAAGNEPDTGLTPGADAAASLFGAADLWIAAELLGIAERSGEMAVAHAGERRQFGQIIGSYQGIKHRIVDDYVLQQNAAAVLQLATRAWDAGQADRRMLAHAARFAASEAALSASAFCIQAHGAMGFSWEHPAHLYYKRARRLANLLGSAGESRAALGEAICAA
ncbi:MAG: hypothetical protein KF849_02365 [Rhizobiaceae bacterium]|nr:hypothetical protein [Rhizobiaceae bacterium]